MKTRHGPTRSRARCVAALVVASGLGVRAQDWRVVDVPAPTGNVGAFDPARRRIVAVGRAGDTQEWDGHRWLHRPVALLPRSAHQGTFDSARGVAVVLSGTPQPNPQIRTWEFDGSVWTLRAAVALDPLGAGIAFDSVRGRTVLFGGGFVQPGNATWEWDGITWRRAVALASPSPRSAPAMTFDAARARVVLFGGHVTSGFSVVRYDDTWEWDGSTWQARTPANRPGPLSGHRLAFDVGRGVAVMFGANQVQGAETWEYDGVTWVQRVGAMPPARAFPGLAHDSARGRTVLWGGTSGPALDDVWEWDGASWLPRAQVRLPSYRVAPATAYSASRDRLVLFGGYDGGTSSAETWEWDGSTWARMAPSTSPPGRYQHSMWADGVDVFAFGGGLPGAPNGNDTWRYDGATWTPMASVVRPPVRHAAAVAFDPTSGGALLFGGTQPGALLTHFGDTWRWSAGGSGWSLVAPSNAPSPRSNAALVGDPLRRCVVLWGGQGSNGPTNDTWEWDGATWTPTSPVHRPPAGTMRSMAFEPSLGAVVLVTTTSAQDWTLQTWAWTGVDWLPLVTPSSITPAGQFTLTAAPGRIRMFDSERLYELTATPPQVASFGARCPPSGPRLFVDTWPRPGALDFGLTSTGHGANAPVFVVLGTQTASAPVGACTLLVQLGGPVVALTSDAAGECRLPVPLASTSTVGFRVFAQAWSLGALSPVATNGVDVTIGR
jgi:hypothetical protein